jgi:hypothetical protein
MATPRLIGATIVCCLLTLPASLALAETGRAAALADLDINEEVHGDVVALGGDVVLGPNAVVHGHVVAVFGTVRSDSAARVDGRVVAVSSLAELRIEPDGGRSAVGVQTAVRLLTAGCWLLATTVIGFLYPGRVRFGVWLVPTIGVKILVLGVLIAVTLYAAMVAAIGLGPTVGVPMMAALAVAFLLIRAVGLTVVGAAVGGRLLNLVARAPLPVTVEVFVGVALMLMTRLVPLAGELIWTFLVVITLGAAVFTVTLAPQRRAVEAARSGGDPRQ